MYATLRTGAWLALLLSGTLLAQLPPSEEFDTPEALKSWQRVYQTEKWGADQLQQLQVDGGKLLLVPRAVVWYQDFRGPLLYREVTGDFIVTTRLQATARDGRSVPGSSFSLGGLMVRQPRDVTPATWRPGGENYIFLSLGTAQAIRRPNQPGQFQFEVKTTEDSRSRLQVRAAPGNEAELRLARLGEYVIALHRQPGEDWTVHMRYRRRDLPARLQAGITCYTDWETCQKLRPKDHNGRALDGGNPDLRVLVDFVRFRRPELPAALAGKDLANPYKVPDAELLTFLGKAAD